MIIFPIRAFFCLILHRSNEIFSTNFTEFIEFSFFKKKKRISMPLNDTNFSIVWKVKARETLTYLNEGVDRLIIGPIGDEELHVFVINLGRCRSYILDPHVAHFLLTDNWMNRKTKLDYFAIKNVFLSRSFSSLGEENFQSFQSRNGRWLRWEQIISRGSLAKNI